MKKNGIFLATLFIVIISVLFFIRPNTAPSSLQAFPSPTCEYYLLAPRFCNTRAQNNKSPEYDSLRNKILSYMETRKKSNELSAYAVYLEDLSSNTTLIINGNDRHFLASLLKVPILLIYLKEAEKDPALLNLTFVATNNIPDQGQNLPPEQSLTPNERYTVSELLRRMILYSDNRSANLLSVYFESKYLGNKDKIVPYALNQLGIDFVTDPATNEEKITVATYAQFYKIFYESSFLAPLASQRSLEQFAHVAFNQGLAAGIPEAVTLANKFAIRNRQGALQLHDCGIIYHPIHPYLLCVMTRGQSEQLLAESIATVSTMVWEYTENRL